MTEQPGTAVVRRMEPSDWQMLKEQAVTLEQAGKGTSILPKGITNRYQISAILQKGFELGFSSMYSLEQIALVNGKPIVQSQALLAVIQRAHGPNAVTKIESTDKRAVFQFYRAGMNAPGELEWTIEMAKTAALLDKSGPWKQYPRTMLRWRCIAEGARLYFADTIAGLYLPDELGVPVTVDASDNVIIDRDSPAIEMEGSDWGPGAIGVIDAVDVQSQYDRIRPGVYMRAAPDGEAAEMEAEEILESIEEPETADESPTDPDPEPLPAGFKPPTENQRITIEKMQRLLGEPGQMPEGLSLSEASQFIAELNTRYHERRHQASVQK